MQNIIYYSISFHYFFISKDTGDIPHVFRLTLGVFAMRRKSRDMKFLLAEIFDGEITGGGIFALRNYRPLCVIYHWIYEHSNLIKIAEGCKKCQILGELTWNYWYFKMSAIWTIIVSQFCCKYNFGLYSL